MSIIVSSTILLKQRTFLSFRAIYFDYKWYLVQWYKVPDYFCWWMQTSIWCSWVSLGRLMERRWRISILFACHQCQQGVFQSQSQSKKYKPTRRIGSNMQKSQWYFFWIKITIKHSNILNKVCMFIWHSSSHFSRTL